MKSNVSTPQRLVENKNLVMSRFHGSDSIRVYSTAGGCDAITAEEIIALVQEVNAPIKPLEEEG